MLTRRCMRSFSVLALPALLALLLGACGASAPPASVSTAAPATVVRNTPPDPTSATVTAGGELVVGIEGDLTAVDPAFAYDVNASQVVCQITEGLLTFKDGKTVEPAPGAELCHRQGPGDPYPLG